MPSSVDERADHLREAAAHHRQLVAEPFEGAHQGPRARREHNAVAHGLEVAFLHAGQEPHPLAQRLGEVDLSRHGGRGDRGHLRAAAAALRQQVDHLPLQQGGVRIQHDQVLGPAVQPGRLHGDIDLATRGRLGQRPPQRVDVGAGHRELVAVHRVRGQAHDALDVAAAPRDRPRHRLERRRVDLRRQERDQMAFGDVVHRRLHEGVDRHHHAGPGEALLQQGAHRFYLRAAPCRPPRRAAAGRGPAPAPRRPPQCRARPARRRAAPKCPGRPARSPSPGTARAPRSWTQRRPSR